MPSVRFARQRTWIDLPPLPHLRRRQTRASRLLYAAFRSSGAGDNDARQGSVGWIRRCIRRVVLFPRLKMFPSASVGSSPLSSIFAILISGSRTTRPCGTSSPSIFGVLRSSGGRGGGSGVVFGESPCSERQTSSTRTFSSLTVYACNSSTEHAHIETSSPTTPPPGEPSSASTASGVRVLVSQSLVYRLATRTHTPHLRCTTRNHRLTSEVSE